MFNTGTHAHSGRTAARGPGTTRAMQRLRNRFTGHDDTAVDGDGGFTMIEAVVSFGIFAVVTAAAVLAIVTGISGSNANRDRVTAANVAQQAIAQVQSMPTARLTAAPTATTTNTVGNEPYTVTRRVSYSASATNGAVPAPTACPSSITTGTAYWMNVSVTVVWPGNQGRAVRMDTVLAC